MLVQGTLKAGQIIKIKGIPFRLCTDAVVEDPQANNSTDAPPQKVPDDWYNDPSYLPTYGNAIADKVEAYVRSMLLDGITSLGASAAKANLAKEIDEAIKELAS